MLSSQSVQGLAQALDLLVAFTDVKQKAITTDESNLADRLKVALQTVFGERDANNLEGLMIRLRIRHGFWIGRLHKLNTPNFNVEDGLAAVRLLHPLYTPQSSINGLTLIGQLGLPELQKQWCVFKRSYLDVCEQGGWCREQVEAKLDRLEAIAEPARQQSCEKWNRSAMRKEELLTRRGQRCESVACRLERLALATLALWRGGEARAANRALKHATQARLRQLATARQKARAWRAERDARWKRMNRRDITMADIFQQQAAFGHQANPT